jgi:hypothetical protein
MADRRPCAPNEFGLQGPSANGRPVPTGKVPFASAEADAWRGGCRMNSAWEGLRPMVGLRRPKNVPCVGGGRRLARRVPNEFGLGRPSADGRPVPTGRVSFALAEADAWRGGCRMNSAWEGLRPVVGLRRPGRSFALAEADAWRGGCRMNSACGGLRPAVGLRRPKGWSLRRRRPTPGAERRSGRGRTGDSGIRARIRRWFLSPVTEDSGRS